MGEAAHHERLQNMGSALRRLSAAREQRGPVGVIDPLQLAKDAAEETTPRSLATGLPRANKRGGLFTFSDRARAASDRLEQE